MTDKCSQLNCFSFLLFFLRIFKWMRGRSKKKKKTISSPNNLKKKNYHSRRWLERDCPLPLAFFAESFKSIGKKKRLIFFFFLLFPFPAGWGGASTNDLRTARIVAFFSFSLSFSCTFSFFLSFSHPLSLSCPSLTPHTRVGRLV